MNNLHQIILVIAMDALDVQCLLLWRFSVLLEVSGLKEKIKVLLKTLISHLMQFTDSFTVDSASWLSESPSQCLPPWRAALPEFLSSKVQIPSCCGAWCGWMWRQSPSVLSEWDQDLLEVHDAYFVGWRDWGIPSHRRWSAHLAEYEQHCGCAECFWFVLLELLLAHFSEECNPAQ